MKTLKKFATLALGLLLALGFCAFTACGGGNNEATAYTFYVKNADGSNVTEGYVELCVVNEDGSPAYCLNPAPIENGKVVYNKDFMGNEITIEEPGVYEVHVLAADMSTTIELAEAYLTSAEEFGEYTIVLK